MSCVPTNQKPWRGPPSSQKMDKLLITFLFFSLVARMRWQPASTHLSLISQEAYKNWTDSMSVHFQKFSDWYRLKKSIAWVLRYRSNLLSAIKTRQKTGQIKTQPEKLSLISTEELENAERAILKVVQQTVFQDEINTLNRSSDRRVKRTSSLVKLDPFFRNGLLCVGGRLAQAVCRQRQNIRLSCQRIATSQASSLIIITSFQVTQGDSMC